MTKDRKQRMQEAQSLWEQGKTASEISAIMYISYNTAVEYVRDMPDWEDRKRTSKKEKIYALILEGKSTSEIKEITGRSERVINKYRMELRNMRDGIKPEEQCNDVPLGFKWKWPVTVNLIRREPMDVPKHSKEEELEYLKS